MSSYIEISKQEAERLAKDWEEDRESVIQEQFVYEDEGQYKTIDNRACEFFVESFVSFTVAEIYLNEFATVDECLLVDKVVGETLRALDQNFDNLREKYESKCADYNDLKCAVDERTKLYSEQTNTINKLCARIHKLEKIIISKELEKLENE
ncbi:MAG: hypothetical protein ACRC17_06350 [Culicoidibacterales bacterium]